MAGSNFTSVGTIIERKRRNLGSSVQQFPKNLGAHAMLLTFKRYEYEKPGTRALNKLSNSTLSKTNLAASDNIMLPLPSELRDSYNIGLSVANQQIGGEIVSSVAKSATNMQDISLDSFKKAFESALPGVNMNSLNGLDINDIAQGAAFLGRRSIANAMPGVSQNIDVGLGSVINPKQALFFTGIDLKKHSFSWTFAPTNSVESNILKSISTTIRRNILPSYGNVGPVSRLLLNYPSVVDIYFFGVDQSYFLYYKTCMVENFNIDFAPNGLAFVAGGKPAAIRMEMMVSEMDIHTSEDHGGSGTFEPLSAEQQMLFDAQNGLGGL